ncbi:MAG: L-threonylcarbamoyladenylate synthase [Alphaproteobacteria bacterium]|nr:L-threonylcarbamoyladenylate synthase [Alphaproteobacteria bacterium]
MTRASLISDPTPAAIAKATRLLREGKLVAFPTETVYGLGADATRDEAVASIFAAKGRPQFNPLIVHVATLQAAEQYGVFDAPARALASRFWPGALTLVVPRAKDCDISWLATAGLETIALRCPAHSIAQQLLAAFGGPIAAPSANLSGTVSSTTAQHVADGFGDAIELVLDGGRTVLGLESTIVGLTEAQPTLLRPGAIAREEIEAVVGRLGVAQDHAEAPHSPGRLKRHYATATPLRLNASSVEAGEVLLAFGPAVGGAVRTLNLSPSGDLKEAAANLFAMLRTLDAVGARAIAVMPVPETGLGEAISDRLQRAAVRE